METLGILGCGTWGTALARMLANSGRDVILWSALPEEVEELSRTRRHKNLPGMTIPDAVQFTRDLKKACARDIVVFAVPSVFIRSTARQAAPFLDGRIVVSVAKGIEPGKDLILTDVMEEEFHAAGVQCRVAALSGPTHAEEVAMDLPTTIVAASRDEAAAKAVQVVFTNENMRVYTNPDLLGVELCGALKNIMALASGISTGLGYGDNARAAIITRGLAEMRRLGLQMGCSAETFSGLAGVGDLIVTATSRHSRNNRAGELMGQGFTAEQAQKEVGMVVEGIHALPAAMELAKRYHVEMPITFAVHDVVFQGADPSRVVRRLMGRMMRDENAREGYEITEQMLLSGRE